MGLNDSFLMRFASPAAKKGGGANDSFNDSFNDKNTVSPSTILRALQKEQDQITAVLRFHPPTASQYQNSLIELISLSERCEEQDSLEFQKLVVSVFLKLAANILTGLEKPKYQPTLYKLSQIIADNLKNTEDEDGKNLKQWKDRVVIETSIHLEDYPNFELDLSFSTEDIIDELGLSNGRFQFVKSSIFETARQMATDRKSRKIAAAIRIFDLENVGDEHFLRLLLWLLLKNKSTKPLEGFDVFKSLPRTPEAGKIRQSPCSNLDVQIFLYSLSIHASTTTESGTTAKNAPSVASQLSLTKHQKDCWKALVDNTFKTINEDPPSALCRLRISQLVDSIRLTSDGSEDVRVLFSAWKNCLQLSASFDEEVFEAVKEMKEMYWSKMNALLCYGPSYSTEPTTIGRAAVDGRSELRMMFPLQFDYQFVDTQEADRIGLVINSFRERLAADSESESSASSEEHPEELDDTFHSCVTPHFSPDNSQFFSPMMHNRHSMCPTSAQKFLTPTRPPNFTPSKSTPSDAQTPPPPTLSIERLQNVEVNEEESEDELEAALLESTHKHESMILSKSSPSTPRTPMKDAQTDTDDVSSESSIISVKYNTPKKTREVLKKKEDVRGLEERKEPEDDDLLDDETFELMMEQVREATMALFVDRRLAKFGIAHQKIQTENVSDEEIVRQAELKLAKIAKDLSANLKRLEKLAVPTERLKPLNLHDSTKCFGCQSDEIQERALRYLEKMALDWDAEGNDYLLAKC